jgi:hypothetical protein
MAMLLLAGCGLLQVEERAIPSVPGAVEATAWESQSATLPEEMASAPPVSDPVEYLDRLVETAVNDRTPDGEVRHGLLSRDGSTAVGYLQLVGPVGDSQVAAYEVRISLARDDDGAWTLSGVETRIQCHEPLEAGECAPALDNSGG